MEGVWSAKDAKQRENAHEYMGRERDGSTAVITDLNGVR
jgi:hypothetical protein